METVVNEKFIASITKVLPDIFRQMMQLDPQIVGLNKYGEGAKPAYSLSTIIGVKGSHFAGFFSLNLIDAVAIKAASNMLGTAFDSMNDDVKDAAGEITNIVAGNIKTDLDLQGIKFDITVPTVVTGDHIVLHALREIEPVCVVFALPEGKFALEFGIKNI